MKNNVLVRMGTLTAALLLGGATTLINASAASAAPAEYYGPNNHIGLACGVNSYPEMTIYYNCTSHGEKVKVRYASVNLTGPEKCVAPYYEWDVDPEYHNFWDMRKVGDC